MKALRIFLLMVLPLASLHAEIPEFLRQADFNAATFAQAVNYYVSLGETPAIRELNALYSPPEPGKLEKATFHADINVDVAGRIGLICRVLFLPLGKRPLRNAMYGALMLPMNWQGLKDWPLYPVATSGQSYFVLAEGYDLAGYPEDVGHYLAYCRSQGNLRAKPIAVPSRVQAQADALALRRSRAWKAIKWSAHGHNWSYTLDEVRTFNFIQAQADSIP